jgi:hypothetical protein
MPSRNGWLGATGLSRLKTELYSGIWFAQKKHSHPLLLLISGVCLVPNLRGLPFLGPNPAVSDTRTKPENRSPDHDDLLRLRLVDVIDIRHWMVRLEIAIDWDVFEKEWSGFFPSPTTVLANASTVLAA